MGCGVSSIDSDLKRDREKAAKIHKLLLLGTGNSGKSTFFKQLTQLHGGGFHDEEFTSSAKHIQDAIVVQMKHILMTFKTNDSDEFKVDLDEDLMESAKKVSDLSPERPLSEVVDDIEKLWAHKKIKDAFKNRSNLGISDSAPFFFDDLDRIRAINYRPTADDILFARIPTTGLRDKSFTIKGTVFNIYDVGGQRSERNKWIHCFDTVHGILFVASLSCYDQMLYEENELNAMYEALELFQIVVNSRYFSHASQILFLNKSDLFETKIKIKPLTVCFPEYKGNAHDFADCAAYIKQKFVDQCKHEMNKKSIYTHITCATDQLQVKRVFDDVQHFVVTRALKNNGLV